MSAMAEIRPLIERWKALKDERDRLAQADSDAAGEIDLVRDKLFKLMEAAGLTNLKSPTETIYLQASAYAKVLKSQEEVIAWFDAQGAPEVAPRRLLVSHIKDYVTTALELDKPLPPADLIDLNPVKEVRMKRTGTKGGTTNEG